MGKIAEVRTIDVSISIISHAQADLVENLLQDIEQYCSDSSVELILTLNLEETLPFDIKSFSFPVKVLRNKSVLGFAANHNQAFEYAAGRNFCVLNPDIRFCNNPFHALALCLEDASAGVAAPIVLNEAGAAEDSIRHFPSPLKILCKLFGGCKGGDYEIGEELITPDWAGGMFLLFPRDVFERLGGFDHRYFLYYEDVDICARIRLLGYEVAVSPHAKVVHHAQRNSHRNIKYLWWHLRSMMRFFFSSVFWRL